MYIIELDIQTMVFRLLLAAVLGGIIGWERATKNKQAGFKTHLLVSLGSALIMLTSIYGFNDHLLNHPNARFDPARLSAQVVSGIGFLGAGAILRRSNHVISGLTTAATLWLVAGIGLSVGAGFYWPAAATTIIVLFSILLLNKLEAKFHIFKKSGTLKLTMAQRPEKMETITSLLPQMTIEQVAVSEERNDPQNIRFLMEFRIHSAKRKGLDQLFEQIWKIEGVREVRVNWKE